MLEQTTGRWFLPIVLCVAAFLRLVHLDLVSITNDEGSHTHIAQYVVGAPVENWPLAGLPSVGIRNSALFIYLIAVANTVYYHPLSGVVLVAALNVVAIYLAWRLTVRHFGIQPARIVAVLYAFSPWSVLFARNMWPPSCLAIACLWFVDLGLRWLQSGGKRGLGTLGFLAFVIPQIHFSGFIAPLWLMCVLWTGRARIRWASLGVGAGIGLATCTPWFEFQRINAWIDLRSLGSVAEGKQGLLTTFRDIITYFQQQLHSGGFEYWFGRGPNDLPEFFSGPLRGLCDVWGAVLVGCFLGGAWAALRSREQPSLRFLLLWCVLPVLGLLVVRPIVQPHYLLVAYPVPLIVASVFLAEVIEHRFARGTPVLVLLLVGIAATHSVFLFGWYQYVDEGRTDGQGHYELSYRQRRAAARSVLDDCPDRSVDIAGPFAGQNAAYANVYSYEQLRRQYHLHPADPTLRYWIDLSPVNVSDPQQRKDHEASMSSLLARFQETPDSWRIEKHWRVGPSRIYKLRLGVP